MASEDPKKKKGRGIFKAASFWISIGLSIVILLIYVLSRPEIGILGSAGILDSIEARTLDIRFWLRGKIQPADDIVIIAVDEKTDDELGRWQTSGRKWIAQLLDILHEGGATVIGFDLVLPEPDEGAGVQAVNEIAAYYLKTSQDTSSNQEQILEYFENVKAEHDYDKQLAKAIENNGNVILGLYHFFSAKGAEHLTSEKNEAYRELIKRAKYTIAKFPPGITRQPLRLLHSYGVEPNLSIFSEAAKSFGHFNVISSRDGYIRHSPLLIEYMGDYYPSLDLEIARAYLNPSLPPIIHALGKEGGGSVNFVELGKIPIPTDDEGKLFINFYGPGETFPHYSLSDVVLGKIAPTTFQDKIVLLGFTAMSYQDLHSASFQSGSYPGVEVHATIIENIIRKDFLIKPGSATLVAALLIFILGVTLGIVSNRWNPLKGAITALICLAIVAGIAYAAFIYQRIWLNVTFPFLFVMLDYVALTAYKYFTEEKAKKEVKNAFQHYVSPAVVDHMLESVDMLHLGGERRQLTALFSDIRGFTSISEGMSSEDLVQFLNEYLTAMTNIVMDYEGTVDKYMGDAIMAFYGAPLEQPDHAVRACKTAIKMMERLKEMRIGWAERNLPFMNIGIGINSGDMSVGNMGSEDRFDYTIMGDNVNLASRLEGINKEYGTNIVISQFTCDLIRNDSFSIRELDSVRVKGKKEPVTIYELVGQGTLDQEQQTLLKMFAEGLNAYKLQQWDQAISLFKEASQLPLDDRPSKIYTKRCQDYQQNPPPENWDGVYVMKTK